MSDEAAEESKYTFTLQIFERDGTPVCRYAGEPYDTWSKLEGVDIGFLPPVFQLGRYLIEAIHDYNEVAAKILENPAVGEMLEKLAADPKYKKSMN